MAKNSGPATVGPREAAAVGVLAMGVFMLVLPFAVGSIKIDAPDQAFPTLAAMNVLAGLFTLGAGVAFIRAKDCVFVSSRLVARPPPDRTAGCGRAARLPLSPVR